ncbi:MAG: DUF433 domain-containing protein [Chloroflexi bacterium]|nr:DUF433 domain-containing protein [Chloroflexota bacterium]
MASFHPPAELSIENPIHRDSVGVLRVGKTRVTLDTIVNAYESGATAEEIALNYDALTLPQVYASITYYLQHKAELAPYLAARKQAALDAMTAVVQRQAMTNVRERLLARQASQGKA